MVTLTPAELSHLLGEPIQSPPEGTTANFINPKSTAYQVYITAGVCSVLTLLSALLRYVSLVYYRRRTIHVAGEIVFGTGLVLCLVFIALTVACVSGGAFGRNAWDVRLGDFTKSQLVLALLVEILSPLAICIVKVSVLILYLLIFRIRDWMRIACISGMVVITAFYLANSVSFAAMCAPPPSEDGGSQLDYLAAFISENCDHSRVIVLIQGVFSAATDLYLLILPLPAIWTLQMSLQRKLATSAMFSIGLCACASSIASLAYRVIYFKAGSDNTRLTVPIWATAMAEQTAGIIVCCMSPVAILFKSMKEPVQSWLSAAAQRLTSFSRPDADSLPKGSARVYSRLGSQSSHPTFEPDTYPLQTMMDRNSTGTEKD